MKASDLFIKSLENEGVKYIFGLPGEENLDIIDSIFKSKKIKLIITRHEQAAGFMAATYGRLSGKPGVCLSTLGPGATNLVTPATYSLLGGFPMILLTGQKPIRENKQGLFQIVDVCQMMEPITKATQSVIDANHIPFIIRNSFKIARREKPGPVHIELPEDVASEETNRTPLPINPPQYARADEIFIKKAADLIHKAKFPILLIASGANRYRVRGSLLELLNKTGIFFCTTQMGKGVIDERHPSFLGTAALSAHDYLHCALDRSDLIINIGHDVVEKPPFIMNQKDNKQVIHINYYPAIIDDVYFPQLEVVGKLSSSISRLTKYLNKSPNWDIKYFERMRDEINKNIFDCVPSNDFPNSPEKIISDIRSAVPDDGILTLDNGMYKIWFARHYKAHNPNTILLDNALATMGAGLPSAMAAKLVHPDKPVIAICGDGGFLMNGQELETAKRYNIDLTIIVLVDKAFGMIKWKQAGTGLTVQGLDFDNPNFQDLAKAYGAHGYKITSTGELPKTLSHCMNTKGVHLIEVPVNYDDNEKVFYQELYNKTCII
ncbi:MAG: acetolactate synthase large subunit [Bacteroidales bacterium]